MTRTACNRVVRYLTGQDSPQILGFEGVGRMTTDLPSLKRLQFRLVMQSAIFVLIGTILSSQLQALTAVMMFIFNLFFAGLTFVRALGVRKQIHAASTDRRVTPSDKVMAAMVALMMFIIGANTVALARQIGMENEIKAIGECWSSDDSYTYSVACDNPAAIYRTTAIVDDKALCPLDYLDSNTPGRFICIEPLK